MWFFSAGLFECQKRTHIITVFQSPLRRFLILRASRPTFDQRCATIIPISISRGCPIVLRAFFDADSHDALHDFGYRYLKFDR
ncbi:hypothetical protein ASD67_10690 [Sphingopyxis sp. Root1497]|nr:hypothetical protein ASD67_10690 [Sphingopyxis sp. Root1497]